MSIGENAQKKEEERRKKKGSTDLSRFLVYGRERRSTSHDRVFGLADKRSLSEAEESQKEERQEIEKAHLYRESTLFSSETTGRHSKPEAIAHSWVLYYTFLIRLRSRLRHSLFGLCLISYSLLFFFLLLLFLPLLFFLLEIQRDCCARFCVYFG